MLTPKFVRPAINLFHFFDGFVSLHSSTIGKLWGRLNCPPQNSVSDEWLFWIFPKCIVSRAVHLHSLSIFLIIPVPSPAYSVLTHEAIIDVVWDTNLRPLLLKRFPDASSR